MIASYSIWYQITWHKSDVNKCVLKATLFTAYVSNSLYCTTGTIATTFVIINKTQTQQIHHKIALYCARSLLLLLALLPRLTSPVSTNAFWWLLCFRVTYCMLLSFRCHLFILFAVARGFTLVWCYGSIEFITRFISPGTWHVCSGYQVAPSALRGHNTKNQAALLWDDPVGWTKCPVLDNAPSRGSVLAASGTVTEDPSNLKFSLTVMHCLLQMDANNFSYIKWIIVTSTSCLATLHMCQPKMIPSVIVISQE